MKVKDIFRLAKNQEKYSQIIYLIKDLYPKYINYIKRSKTQQLEDLPQF